MLDKAVFKTSGGSSSDSVERELRRGRYQRTCEHCQKPYTAKKPHSRFCSDPCRAAFHAQITIKGRHGKVSGVRALVSGGWSITIHVQGDTPPSLRPGDPAVIGAGD